MTSGEPEEPIVVLRELELDPERDLPMRVRRGIERRFLGRDLVGFSFKALAHVIMEWLSTLLGGVSVPPSRPGRK